MRPQAMPVRDHVVLAVIVAVSLVYSLHLTSLLHAKLAALCIGVVILAIAAARREEAAWHGLHRLGPLWVFLAIACIRLLVVPVRVPTDAVTVLAYGALLLAAATMAAGTVSSEKGPEVLAKTVACLSALVAALGLAQYTGLAGFLFPPFPEYGQRMYGVFGNQDLTGGFIAMGIPLLFQWAARATGPAARRVPLYAAVIIALAGLLLSESRSAWIAGAAGIGTAWAIMGVKPPYAKWIAAAMAAATLVIVISFPQSTIRRLTEETGIRARVAMWRAAVDMASERPFLGVGAGQYAYWSPLYIGNQGIHTIMPAASRERHADQPHSEPLRVCSETGLLGLSCWVWMGVIWIRRRRLPAFRSAAGPVAAFTAFSLFNGTLESPPHALIALLFFTAPLATESAPTRHCRTRAIPVAAAALALFVAGTVLPGSAMLRKAQDVQIGNSEAALPYYARAVAWPWPYAAAHRDYAIALAEAGHDNEARREFEQALNGMDTGDIYLGLAIVAHRNADAGAACAYARECLRRWPSCDEARQLLETLSR